ncbi:hypothetical protein llap_15682 [Limosa lapponica baueri]|uniref:Cytoplasmic polyadenylation element-binding protein 1 n=1 Tax=Limosa lapponica baueri TaxID=1758121 RepID=A0A2I0TJM5_LIMLA|nr:hypothetical protein llap_15682 [Limosa lapponica baueri]
MVCALRALKTGRALLEERDSFEGFREEGELYQGKKEDTGRSIKDCWDSPDAPALTTCSNADIFRQINAMLDNSLDFSGVCTTPIRKSKRDILPGNALGCVQGELEDSSLVEVGESLGLSAVIPWQSLAVTPGRDFQDSEEAVASSMLFPTSTQESSRGLPDTNDLCLGLQSLNLTGWDRPWSTQDSDAAAQTSTQSVLGMLSNPLGNVLGRPPLGFLPLDPIGSDLSEKFSTPTLRSSRLDSRSLLDSRSSSPSDSDTSGFSSGSDHLSDLISSLRISPPLPFLPLSAVSRDSLKMGVGSRLDQDQAAPAAVTPSSASASKRWPGASAWPSWDLLDSPEDPFSIEREARLHRQAAAMNEATCTWSGQLPPRHYKNPTYSCKVFLGGVPWDITEAGLINTFRAFGSLSVEWPGKDGKHPRCPPKGNMPKGNSDTVQVIPWVLADSNFVRSPSQRLDPSKTVFVGALHGMLNAEALAAVMCDLFGGVIYAGIDTDKHKYPIGSGRVTFNNQRSYLKAVTAAFVEIKTTKFTKKVSGAAGGGPGELNLG